MYILQSNRIKFKNGSRNSIFAAGVYLDMGSTTEGKGVMLVPL